MTDERKALVETYFETFGQTPGFHAVYGEGEDRERGFRFAKLVDCGAYLDAAMMLVPERCWIRMDDWPRDMVHGAVASVCPLVKEADNPVYSATGDTMALALLGAIREARKNA